jgi:hypothetical protein
MTVMDRFISRPPQPGVLATDNDDLFSILCSNVALRLFPFAKNKKPAQKKFCCRFHHSLSDALGDHVGRSVHRVNKTTGAERASSPCRVRRAARLLAGLCWQSMPRAVSRSSGIAVQHPRVVPVAPPPSSFNSGSSATRLFCCFAPDSSAIDAPCGLLENSTGPLTNQGKNSKRGRRF